MEITSSSAIRDTIYHYGQRDNNKELKFHINNSSYFEISSSILKFRLPKMSHLKASKLNMHWERAVMYIN